MFRFFYSLPLNTAFFASLSFLIVWTMLAIIFAKINRDKVFRTLNIVFTLCAVLLIVYLGILRREIGSQHYYSINPFDLFIRAKDQEELYRSMYMNLIMFLPLGVFLPYTLSFRSITVTAIISIFIGMLISFVVEFLQYYFSLGQAEAADVMCNTFGMICGVIPYVISKLIIRNKYKN